VIKDDLLTSAPIIRALCVTDLIIYQGDTLINSIGKEVHRSTRYILFVKNSRYSCSCAVGRAEETKRDENLAAFIANGRKIRDIINDVTKTRKQVQT
jgi:hypothetical protein